MWQQPPAAALAAPAECTYAFALAPRSWHTHANMQRMRERVTRFTCAMYNAISLAYAGCSECSAFALLHARARAH